MTYSLHLGDCRDVLKTLAEASVDSIVTDPPYELGFMGKGWDSTGIANDGALWRAALRALKPGGHLLAFSGTRTYHRMACAIEDAGFDIRDQIGWAYGSGFPKSHNGEWGGTALKPAWEPICMARKPLVGTVEANWLAYGTGALNIDGCRVGLEGAQFAPGYIGRPTQVADTEGFSMPPVAHSMYKPEGRWPANLVHDGSDDVLAAFPDAPGQQRSVGPEHGAKASINCYGDFGAREQFDPRNDGGSAARFFYCAKASAEDRNEGCTGLPGVVISVWGGDEDDLSAGKKSTKARANTHPTVKPTDLMRYLCRLVTPKDGLVLDPFMGSGSTGKAAMLEGLRFVGIDLTPEYIEIARARIEFAKRQGYQPDLLAAA